MIDKQPQVSGISQTARGVLAQLECGNPPRDQVSGLMRLGLQRYEIATLTAARIRSVEAWLYGESVSKEYAEQLMLLGKVTAAACTLIRGYGDIEPAANYFRETNENLEGKTPLEHFAEAPIQTAQVIGMHAAELILSKAAAAS